MTLPLPKPYESKVIAIDLDGTLAEPMYPSPEIGAPIQKMVDAAIEYQRLGHELALYTSRPEDHRDRILRWLRVNGIEDVFYTVVCGKLKYALLIDDRAVNFPGAFETVVSQWSTWSLGDYHTHSFTDGFGGGISSCYQKDCSRPRNVAR